MFVVPKAHARFVLRHRDGRRRFFYSREEVVRQLGEDFLRERIGARFFRSSVANGFLMRPCVDYVLEDDLGRALSARDFEDLFYRRRAIAWRPSWLDSYCGGGPVPGTGRSRKGSYFRGPHTTDERRMNQHIDADEPQARPCRCERHLPTSWDDRPVAARLVRSWKRYRRTQWKG